MPYFDDLSKFSQWLLCETMTQEDFNRIEGPYIFQILVNGNELPFDKFTRHVENSLDRLIQERAEKIALEVEINRVKVYRELLDRLYNAQSEFLMIESIYETTITNLHKLEGE